MGNHTDIHDRHRMIVLYLTWLSLHTMQDKPQVATYL